MTGTMARPFHIQIADANMPVLRSGMFNKVADQVCTASAGAYKQDGLHTCGFTRMAIQRERSTDFRVPKVVCSSARLGILHDLSYRRFHFGIRLANERMVNCNFNPTKAELMKILITHLAILAACSGVWSQTANAVVFSENGERFTLFLNGEKKNNSPAANVKVSGLTGEFYQARIDFEDPSLPDFSNTNFAVQKGLEVTYVVKMNKKGEYVLRYTSESAIGSSPAVSEEPTEDTRRFAAADDEAPASQPGSGASEMNMNAGGTGINQAMTVTGTTSTTTTSNARPASESVGINMNVGGVSMGVNVNVTGTDMEMGVEQNTTTVTRTSATQTTTTIAQPAAAVSEPQSGRQEIVAPGCSVPMNKASFDRAKQSVADKGFDETRLSTAKQIARSNCLSTSQIVDIMGTFGFEETKLDFAKFAYDYCTDKGNYYLVGDAFSFSSSTEELNSFLETK